MAFEWKYHTASEDRERLFKKGRPVVTRKGYSDLKYSIEILNNGDGTYSVEVPKLPGCYSSGRTKAECIAHAVEAIELHLEGTKKRPAIDPIPEIRVSSAAPSPQASLVSLPEACRLLDISDATMRRYIKDGKLPAYNFGKEYKFKVQELADFVDSRRISARQLRKSG